MASKVNSHRPRTLRFTHLVVLFWLTTLLVLQQPSPVQSQRLSRLWWNEFKKPNTTTTTTTTTTTPGNGFGNTYLRSPSTASSIPLGTSQPQVGTFQLPVSQNEDSTLSSSSSFSSSSLQAPVPTDEYSTFDDSSVGDTSSLTDDELLTQASKMSSKMTRKSAKSAGKFNRRATQFDDSAEQDVFQDTQLASTAAASSINSRQFLRRSDRFVDDSAERNGGERGGDDRGSRIWSYFDNALSRGDQQGSPIGSRDRSSGDRSNGRIERDNDADDFITRQFNKRQSNGRSSGAPNGFSSSSASSAKKPSGSTKDPNVLNFNFNRKKNVEEKQQWRQLIQSIFDSTPRRSDYPGARVSTKTKFADLPFSYSGKPKVRGETTSNSLDTKSKPNDDDDVLKGEPEEKVDLKDPAEDEEEEAEDADVPPAEEMDASKEVDNSDTTVNKKRDAEIAQEDEDEEPEDEPQQDDEDNQYLRSRSNQTVANIGNGSAKRSTTGTSRSGSSFGSRINRSNATTPQSPGRTIQKPKFRMHFQLGKNSGSTTTESGIDDQLITALENDPAFRNNPSTASYGSVGQSTTSSPLDFSSPSTERFDVFDSSTEDDDLFERSQPVTTSTASASTTTTESPNSLAKRGASSSSSPSSSSSASSKSRTGKWMDNETFRVNDDRSMIMLDEEEEDEEILEDNNSNTSNADGFGSNEEEPSGNAVTSRRNKQPAITKRKLTTPTLRAPAPRTVRQDDLTGSDDISRLAKALPGTPGQDYPIFGQIPRTAFNCRDHKWPGYYADLETQCQVFHICQTGGRKNSFLCPNGTMFNQQLFICDWWHNVQCDQVASHYELNQNIYDYNWEAKRMKKSTDELSSGGDNLSRRMGVIKGAAGNETSDDLATTTTVSSIIDTIDSDAVTTTESSSFTETVFGNRKSGDDSSEEQVEQKKKRSSQSSGGVKGGKLIKFNRISSSSSSSSSKVPRSSSSSSTSNSFLNRFKFATQQQGAVQQQKVSAALKVHPRSSSSNSNKFGSAHALVSSVTSSHRTNQHRNPLASASSYTPSTLHRSKYYRA